jgi:hypothetical protein
MITKSKGASKIDTKFILKVRPTTKVVWVAYISIEELTKS